MTLSVEQRARLWQRMRTSPDPATRALAEADLKRDADDHRTAWRPPGDEGSS